MISMQGVPSILIARNQSWVRKQAQALVRHLPANVERADLIQVGLIAVAQAAVSFEWEGDRDTPEAQEGFVRYARMRVKGAMLDELRQMDFMSRGDRRKIKLIQIAREKCRAKGGQEPNVSQLAELTGLDADEINALMQADDLGRNQVHLGDEGEADDRGAEQRLHPATPQDEVEARVDTGIVLRRLEGFFAALPDRERMVIDAYLGVGLTPIEVARSLNISASRVSQMYHSVVQRAAAHFGNAPAKRSVDRVLPDKSSARFQALIDQREADLRHSRQGSWGELIEKALHKQPAAEDPSLSTTDA
jgi:RNA polymerase sigma factor for flagellar operon FliA